MGGSRYQFKEFLFKRFRGRALWIVVICMIAAIFAAAVLGVKITRETPQQLLLQYMDYIPEQEYDKMYEMVDVGESGDISREDFVERNSAIYEGIGLQNMTVEILEYDKAEKTVTYRTSFDTSAGNIALKMRRFFRKETEDTG